MAWTWELHQLQWGHGDEAVEERRLSIYTYFSISCFNGATAMKPWKRWSSWTTKCTASTCFNGATAMKPWKRNLILKALSSIRWLQWGHGDEAVEEYRLKSMQPSHLTLQWGHGDEAVEERT